MIFLSPYLSITKTTMYKAHYAIQLILFCFLTLPTAVYANTSNTTNTRNIDITRDIDIKSNIEKAIEYYNEGELERARHKFNHALNIQSEKDQALLYLGRIAFDLGNAKEATSFFLKAVEHPPIISDEYYWLARAYGDLARKSESIKGLPLARKLKKYANLAVETNPKSIHALALLIDYHLIAPFFLGGSNKTAQENIDKLHALSSIDADIKQLALLNKKNKYKDALILAESVALDYPNSAEALHSAGRTFQSHGLLDKALQCFEKSLSLNPTPQNSYYIDKAKYRFSETALWNNVRTEDAIEILTSLIKSKEKDVYFERNWPIWTLAKLHLYKGNIDEYKHLRNSLDFDSLKKDNTLKKDVTKYDKANNY